QSVVAPSATPSHKYRPVLLAAAILLGIATVVYSAAWMYCVRRAPQVEIGIDESYSSAGVEIDNVRPNTPAEKAGLKAHDRIVAINGRRADSSAAWNGALYRVWLRAKPGDILTLTVQRAGQSQPLIITPVFRALQGAGDTKTLVRTIADQILESYPLLFLIVGLAVLFLRVDNRDAWLLAMVFASFLTAPGLPSSFLVAPDGLRHFLLAFNTIVGGLLPALFYFFFAVFPTRSPIDRKAPWLKWLLPGIGICLGY